MDRVVWEWWHFPKGNYEKMFCGMIIIKMSCHCIIPLSLSVSHSCLCWLAFSLSRRNWSLFLLLDMFSVHYSHKGVFIVNHLYPLASCFFLFWLWPHSSLNSSHFSQFEYASDQQIQPASNSEEYKNHQCHHYHINHFSRREHLLEFCHCCRLFWCLSHF